MSTGDARTADALIVLSLILIVIGAMLVFDPETVREALCK